MTGGRRPHDGERDEQPPASPPSESMRRLPRVLFVTLVALALAVVIAGLFLGGLPDSL